MVDLLKTFEAIKIFIRDENDTLFGLIFFEITAIAILSYLLSVLEFQKYIPQVGIPIVLTILIIWIFKRRIPITRGKFTIGIAPFQLLLLNKKSDLSGEAKRDLRTELVDYVHAALHFNKEKLYIDKYIEVLRLPNRIKINPKNAAKICKKLHIDLMIWGDSYYDGEKMHFRPRFEFLKEPSNVYYKKFRTSLNNLRGFKIDLSKNIENQKTELAHLMHYISYLGLLFHGISLSHGKKFQEAKQCFDHALKSMYDKAFNNRSLSDIYLTIRFFAAQNYHKWGNFLLEKDIKNKKAFELYKKGAESFFERAIEMDKLHDIDEEERLNYSLLYGIYLLIKKKDFTKAEKKLDSLRKKFNKKNLYLFYLYKGIVQKNTNKAKKFFDKSIKIATKKQRSLVYEKIADYFFSKKKFSESIKYFEKKLGINDRQDFNPGLLEEDAHEKLSIAYLKQANLVAGIKEKIIANLNERKNLYENLLSE